MKLTFLKPAVSLFLFISAGCAAMSSAYADNYFSGDITDWDSTNRIVTFYDNDNARKPFDELNKNYLGNAGYLGKWWEQQLDGTYTYAVVLPGYQKRFAGWLRGVFKLEKSSNGEPSGSREDLVFNSKEEASGFCDYLIKVAQASKSQSPGWGIHYATVHITDYFRVVKKAIAVPYWIAYDTGSKPTADGKSTPEQKHVMCANSLGIELDPNTNNENEMTGIRTSSLVPAAAPSTGSYYNVTCMDSRKIPASFYVQGGTIHQHNTQEGAQYCPLS